MENLEHKQKVLIMVAVLAAMFFAAVNMTIVGTSLPKIISKIGGMEYFDWVFTIYMLTSTITAMLVGKLSDIYGRKPFILIGIGIFMVGAFLSGTSDTIYQLIMYRGLQGFGGGMIMSSAFTTVGDLFSPRERGKWQGLLSAMFGLSSLFGPTLGGYIVDHFDWHWVFWIFLPIGFIAFALIWKLYPSKEKVENEQVDYLGSIALTLMIITMLMGFSWAGNRYNWLSFEIIGLFSCSIIALALFIYIEGRVKSPIFPLFMFKNSIFTLSNLAGMFIGMGMFGVIMYTPFFVQGVLGRSATVSGLVEMIMTISLVGASTISGQLISRTGKYKVIALIGVTTMAIGLYTFTLLDPSSSLGRVIIQLIITGIGLGLTMPVFTVTVQNAVQQRFLGVATSAMQVFRQIGGTIGVAVMGTILGNVMRTKMEHSQLEMDPSTFGETAENLEGPQFLMDPEQLETIRTTLPMEVAGDFDQFITFMREALSHSLSSVFLFGTIIVGVAIVVTLFIREIPLRTSNMDEENQQNSASNQ